MTLARRAFVKAAATGAAALLAACATGCDASSDDTETDTDTSTDSTESTIKDSVDKDDPYGTGVHHATIEVADYGTIAFTLNANAAPITVSNFCSLANDGFYDGLTFHRVISGFVIQGGDPEGDGTGGSDTCIKGEFSANGVENDIPHMRGTVSMARSTGYDTASSQFFIVHETSSSNSSSLDGYYAAFGQVTSGMDIVDAICENVETEDDNGTVASENQPVISAITIVD